MDPRLAELYGTNQVDESDLEKAAAAEFADGLTEEGAMDLDGISGEELEALAQEVLAGEEQGEEASDEDVEKLAEADFLGRAMAHAYVQVLREIDKEAGVKEVGSWIHRKATGLGAKVLNIGNKKRLKKISKHFKDAPSAKAHKNYDPKVHGKDVKTHSEYFDKATAEGKKYKEKTRRLAAGVGYGTAAAAAGAAGLAGKKIHDKATEKRASAFDTLAEQRALELLEQNGVAVEETSQYDVLANAVEQRAMEMLAEQGYEFVEGEE